MHIPDKTDHIQCVFGLFHQYHLLSYKPQSAKQSTVTETNPDCFFSFPFYYFVKVSSFFFSRSKILKLKAGYVEMRVILSEGPTPKHFWLRQ